MLNARTKKPVSLAIDTWLLLACCGLVDLHSVFEEATKDLTLKRENPCASLKISFYRDMICLARNCKFLYGMIVLYKRVWP